MNTRGQHRLQVINMPDESQMERLNRAPSFMRQPRYALNPCLECSGECCRLTVALTTVEAVRIALTLGVPITAVVEVAELDEDQRAQVTTPAISLDAGERHLCLVRLLDTLKCRFAMNVEGRWRCGIYSLRPGACRMFPYHVRLNGKEHHVGHQDLCPVKWGKNRKIEERVSGDFTAWMADIKSEVRLAQAWRSADIPCRDAEAFFRFAIPWVARALRLPLPPVDPEPRSLKPALWENAR